MMKILVVTQYFYPESFRVNTFVKELVKRGYEVTVLTGYPQYPYGEIYEGYGFNIPYDKEWNGAKVERLKVFPRGHNAIGLLRNCISFVREGYNWVKKCDEKYDVIYVFEVSPVTVGFNTGVVSTVGLAVAILFTSLADNKSGLSPILFLISAS